MAHLTFCSQAQLPQLNFHFLSPFSGQVFPLDDYPEPLVASGLLGQGVCIKVQQHKLLAPFDGELITVNDAAREWQLQAKNGLKLAIYLHIDEQHLPLNKLQLSHVNRQPIRAGEQLAYYDLRTFKKPLMAAIIVQNHARLGALYCCHKHVQAGADPLLFLTKK